MASSSFISGNFGDIKGFLYAWLGKQNKLPSYEVSQQGTKQRIRFKCELTVISYPYTAIGNSTNKKDAQTNAAIDFCQYLVREGKMSQNELEPYLVNKFIFEYICMMLIHISLILTILTVVINGSIPSSTIETDVNELVKLHKEFLDRSPSVPAIQTYEMRCRAVTECCPDEQENLYTLFSDSQFNEKCLLNGTKLTKSSSTSLCMTTIRQLIQLIKEPIYERYFEILGNNPNRLNRIARWKKQMKMVCSDDELRAHYCERNNMEKFKSCQRKVLEMIAKENVEDDGTIYKTYVSQWEQEYAIDNQKLAKAFPKD
ncbi:unnamed protein product [Adineta steineri]|uniref:DRBM domain-containing protein n=2 Tax=Adineta steineri TaxID=433720 RepID=A0A813NCC5_9BILA|nr:unnamed protein product [Adineta steineri]